MRPSKDQTFLAVAAVLARRSTCYRRRMGCVLVDLYGHTLATGYNGVPRGFAHCNEGAPCPGANASSGMDLDRCEAVHAEANALLQCPDPLQVAVAYCTDSPCLACVKLLLNTGCTHVIFSRPYAHDGAASNLWTSAGRRWEHQRLDAT